MSDRPIQSRCRLAGARPSRIRFRAWSAALLTEERGVAAIEFAMIAPVVVLVLLGTATYFLIGREDYRSQRATYVAADIVARQKTVSNAFLALVKSMSERIATADARTIGFRVTSASYDGKTMTVKWSYAAAPYVQLTTLDGSGLQLPTIASGESLVIVETSVPFQPAFQLLGAKAGRHVNASFARPRSAALVTKSD